MKKAFTLAEILITLMIMGVIAAMTLPSLVLNIQKSQCGPALMKAISDIEQAHRWILNDTDSKTMMAACDIPKDGTAGIAYVECLAPPLKMEKVSLTKEYEYPAHNTNGVISEDFVVNSSSEHIYRLGIVDMWPSNNDGYQATGDGLYRIPIYMDTNGIEKGPNVFGKDMFIVYLNTRTSTIEGNYDANDLLSGKQGIMKMTEACEKDGYSCAQLIMNNKGKITYKW